MASRTNHYSDVARHAALFFLALVATPAPGSPTSGQDAYGFHKVAGEWDISAHKAAPPLDASVVTLTDRRGAKRQLDRELTGSLEDVVGFGPSRLILVLNGDRLAVVDAAAAKVMDEFYAAHTAFSTTHRFIAFTKVIPRWADASELYLVYDMTLSPGQNCMATRCNDVSKGIAVYPGENRATRSYAVTTFDATRDEGRRLPPAVLNAMHSLQSDLFWIDDSRFAFLDCSRTSSDVVLVDLHNGVAKARSASKSLDLTVLVDASKLPNQETPVDGRAWLSAESIAVNEMSGDTVNLHVRLQARPYMKITNVDVSVTLPVE